MKVYCIIVVDVQNNSKNSADLIRYKCNWMIMLVSIAIDIIIINKTNEY